MNLLNALKNQKNLDVGLSGFVENKDNSDISSKISFQIFLSTTAEKYSKNNEKNKSFILL